MKLLTRFLIFVGAILLVSYYVPGVEVGGFYTALIVAVILGALNITVKPVLLLLTLPVTLITLGLFVFVINAALFWFAASFIEDFGVDGFLPALIGTVIISVVSSVGNKLFT